MSIESCLPISKIRDDISKNLNKKIKIKEYKNKKQINEYLGEIIEVYTNLFIAKVVHKTLLQKKSFLYNDISIGFLEYEIIE